MLDKAVQQALRPLMTQAARGLVRLERDEKSGQHIIRLQNHQRARR